MASVAPDPKSGIYRIQFVYAGKPYHKSLKTKAGKEAEALACRIESRIFHLQTGTLQLPPGADLWQWLKSDGREEQKPKLHRPWALADLFHWYFGIQGEGAKEANSLKTEHVHERHFLRILGAKKTLLSIVGEDFQTYINKRSKERWHGKQIQPDTVHKEMDTLQMIWNRAAKLKPIHVTALCPTDGLIYPKRKEKRPFQTWAEIERTIKRGSLSATEKRVMWDSLFLDLEQVAKCLEFVRDKKTRSRYFYPLIVVAAHTGARLSEIMRSRVDDFNFEDRQVLIREKKKSKGVETFRRVPMSDVLANVMRDYFANGHPGGVYSISREANEPIGESTLHEAHEWFFAGSKWQVLRGYHVFRHSFASNLARAGVDERVIDELMGHQTEAMRRRYRHLFPAVKEDGITKLFGKG